MADRDEVIQLAAQRTVDTVKRMSAEYNSLSRVEDPSHYAIQPEQFTSLFYTMLADELEKSEQKSIKSRLMDALLTGMLALNLGLSLYIALTL